MTPLRPDADGDYLHRLLGMTFTAEQLAIITADLTPQLVIAGAGSGKTMVMAARIVHAVAHHRLAPSRVLGLTFTNKAAGELAERVRKSLAALAGSDPGAETWLSDDVPTVATYHSYAAQIVRDHALRIGREPGATLLTEAVQWQLAMRVATRAPGPFEHLNWSTPWVAGLIVALAGDLSDHLASAEDVRRHDARVRAEIEALPKPVKPALEIVERTLARDELLGLVESYSEAKRRLDVIDFGDQVALACAIAEASAEVTAMERDRFGLVVLDEYQDTGVAQRVLLSRLFGDGHSVTAVGDPNQSIYGWRGASPANLSRFGEHFAAGAANSSVLPLMTSFRCDARILAAANAVSAPLYASLIAKGRTAIEIPPLAARPSASEGGEVVAMRSSTALDEAEWLAERVRSALDDGTEPGQVAVLARRRIDFPRLHRAMVERDIPVEVVGLGGLLAMPEVSDIVAVLSLLADSTSNSAAVRLLSGPRWRLGVRDLAALGSRAGLLARARPLGADDADEPAVSGGLAEVLEAATSSVDPVEVPSLLEAAESPGRESRCSPEALERLRRFTIEIRRLRQLAAQPMVDLITEVISTTGLDVEIEAGDAALAEARLANIHAFLDVAAAFTGLDGDGDLGGFLGYLRAASDNEDGLDIGAVSDANTVKLMTVHAAKGLEWDIVAVPGLVDKVFPSDRGRSAWTTGAQVLPFRCRGDAVDLPHLLGYSTADLKAFKEECRGDSNDEERRLAYVAMTRARHQLWLSSYVWSSTRKEPVRESAFLRDVVDLAAPVVTVAEWCADPVPGEVNPLLAVGVSDVAWPALPDEGEMARRREVAAMVEAARAADGDDNGGLNGVALSTAQRWQRDAGLLLDETRRRRQRVVDVPVPARLTTSQIVALARDENAFAAALARPMPMAPVAQATRGSRFHRWVEELHSRAPLLEPDDLPGAEDADINDAELVELQRRFLADGWGDRRPAAIEAQFEMMVGGRLVRGRIDAVYRDGDDRYDVIDYKTGAVPTGRDFEAAALQLSIYRLAWADLAGVDPSAVTAGFLYVRTGLLKRPDRLVDRGELAVILNAPT
ncbi:MAG TPA: ATP-dependent DNA helicase [Mycobacteriales bacterium]|jgi:DNA helicase-2/ATP-dependent DNA helicase PcrA|nr:ATP-dependent DNA helicase [Mycobacteriales bacterium]